jgi:hypothetical protein
LWAGGHPHERACTARCADSRRWDHTSTDYTLTGPRHVAGQGGLFTRLVRHATGATPRGFLRTVAFSEAPAAAPAPRRVTGRAPPVSYAPSGSLGYAEIEGYWLYAGGPNNPAGSYDQAQVAAAITGAESSFLPGIIQPGVDYCGAGADRGRSSPPDAMFPPVLTGS